MIRFGYRHSWLKRTSQEDLDISYLGHGHVNYWRRKYLYYIPNDFLIASAAILVPI